MQLDGSGMRALGLGTQPVFDTERLSLRPRTLADTNQCLAMDREPEVTRFVDGPWSDPVAHRAFIEDRTSKLYPHGMGYWTISRRDAAEVFMGWVLLIPVDAVGPEIEIGWRLRRTCWGRGFAAEAAGRLLAYAFTTLRLPEVIADIHPGNSASLRVAEKIGLKRRGVTQQFEKPAVPYSLRSEEFLASQIGDPPG
jgi:RimJ/RimL family protein N-acetyltransferase